MQALNSVPQPRWRLSPGGSVYPLAVAIVVLVTGAAWPLYLANMTPSIPSLYLIGVLICASTTGRWPAVLCALLSFLAYKFFFVPPIFTFTVVGSEDMVSLLLFLVTALIAGGMAIRVREQAQAANRRAVETSALYDLSQTISVQLAFEQIAPVIVATTARLLACSASRLQIRQPDGTFVTISEMGQMQRWEGLAEAQLRSGADVMGCLQIALVPADAGLSPDAQRLLDLLAGQAALALERSHLSQAAARAEALAESDRLKSTLLSAVSHDFRTPLASIMAAADELVAEDVQWSPAARQEFGSLIRTEAERLNRLVINMLDLTRLESGALSPQRGWYSLAEIVNRVLQRFGPDLADRPLTLQVPEDLPLLPVDYVQIEQVVWNVLQNALKYSPPGSPLVITAELAGTVVALRISDHGPGVPVEERERVFAKFYRYQHPDQARVPGSGVGLTICKGLVEAHGGQIAFSEHHGGGALVEIQLSLQIDPAIPSGKEQR